MLYHHSRGRSDTSACKQARAACCVRHSRALSAQTKQAQSQHTRSGRRIKCKFCWYTQLFETSTASLAHTRTADKHGIPGRFSTAQRRVPTQNYACIRPIQWQLSERAIEQITLFKGTLATMRQRIALCETAPTGRSKKFASRLAHAAVKGIETRIYTQVY